VRGLQISASTRSACIALDHIVNIDNFCNVRLWGAPEARGSTQNGEWQLAHPNRALALLLLTFAATLLIASGLGRGLATEAPAAASKNSLQVGSSAAVPDFSLHDLDGAEHRLEQHAGRVVLVHFFATWCEPCREELASLARLVERHDSKHLSVLAVNVAEVPVRLQRMLQTVPVNFPVLLDADRTVTRAWGVNGLPTTFVLDRALLTRRFVEGDLDWTHPDVISALEEIGTTDPQ
jgi:thiol-disulfide isomerase/thioredoxin